LLCGAHSNRQNAGAPFITIFFRLNVWNILCGPNRTNFRMDKFHADFLVGLNLLRTWKDKLKSVILEAVAQQTQSLCPGIQINGHAELRQALARPVVAQQTLILLDVGVKRYRNHNAVGEGDRQKFARARVEGRLLLRVHFFVMRIELRRAYLCFSNGQR
jgi:hypothetical protein